MQLDLYVPKPCGKAMPEATLHVLNKLKEHPKGITWDNFQTGFALRSRIADLRKAGHSITTINEKLESGCIRARYVLLKASTNHNQ
jgi:hypothetical protein